MAIHLLVCATLPMAAAPRASAARGLLALALALSAGACGNAGKASPGRPIEPAVAAPVDAAPVDAGPATQPDENVFNAKHFVFDDDLDGGAGAVPHVHTRMMWGNYIDRNGNPAVGMHSHDPVSGNAQ